MSRANWDSRSGGRGLSNDIFPCVDEGERLSGVVLESLDRDAKGLARHAYRSGTQFFRVFRAMIEETPGPCAEGCCWNGQLGSCLVLNCG